MQRFVLSNLEKQNCFAMKLAMAGLSPAYRHGRSRGLAPAFGRLRIAPVVVAAPVLTRGNPNDREEIAGLAGGSRFQRDRRSAARALPGNGKRDGTHAGVDGGHLASDDQG